MGLTIELRPLTECDPKELGAEMSDAVRRNGRELKDDFPLLLAAYYTPETAAATIEDRQKQMLRKAGLKVLTVVLGYQPEPGEGGPALQPRFAGIASSRAAHVPRQLTEPRTHEPGQNYSLWLDKDRPDRLRRVGVPLMERRMKYSVDNHAERGRVWTLILPANRRSTRNWEYPYTWGGFERRHEPHGYPVAVDNRQRQLYVARFTLGQLRQKGL